MPDLPTARHYAERLLDSLGLPATMRQMPPEESAAQGWARSGLMSLTGRSDGPPRMCPAALTVCADGALAALSSLAPGQAFQGVRGRDLLAERAAIFGHARAGSASPGGSCRLLQASDGCVALNLAREDDWALLPAWLEQDVPRDWASVSAALRAASVHTLVTRARELGLAAANAKSDPVGAVRWFTASAITRVQPITYVPLVIDLSSLWAGPLCGHLLQLAGARVIKVESTSRPDGARSGPAAFFDLMNAGKQSVALDLSTSQGRKQLQGILQRADIVIESARPRALRQMGIHAEEILRAKPSMCWIAISGYGRGEPEENWIAYGDDAGVAAGLSQNLYDTTGEWLICGDAIADPLTGLHAALAAWTAYRSGRGGLVSLALCEVVRHCMQFTSVPPGTVSASDIVAPAARKPAAVAWALGADTRQVLEEFAV